jgi:hypothetical protein
MVMPTGGPWAAPHLEFAEISPIYRPDHFYPLPMGTTVMLLGSSGPINPDNNTSPFFYVDFVEPVMGLNLHGVTILWTHSNAAPAGYELPAGATSGALAANGGQTVVSPGIFSLGRYELLQFRFALRPIIWAGGANKADDIDLQLALPASINRWTLLSARGRLNMMMQVGMPGDNVIGPIQGANVAAQQAQPVTVPWDAQSFTETFCYEQTGPSFTIINNGPAASIANDAIGIFVWGYDYKLSPALPDGSWQMRQVPGAGATGTRIVAPMKFVTLPVNGRGK